MNNASAPQGINASKAEVTHVAEHGIWLLLENRQLLMSFEHFSRFYNAPVAAIHDVQWPQPQRLYWTQLDIDLAVESIEHPERPPLVAKQG